MAINRFSRITPVNFQFATVPLQAALMAFQVKQKRFDVSREMADQLETFSVPHLPQDKELVESVVGGYQQRIRDRLAEVSGDYSRVYSELRNIKTELAKQMNPGGTLSAVAQKRAEFYDILSQAKKDPSKYDPTLVSLWQAAYMDPNSPYYYRGIGKGGENTFFEPIAETPGLHELALKAIAAIPTKKFKAPGDISIDTEKGVISTTEKGVPQVYRPVPGIYAFSQTTLEYKTPAEVEAAVINAWMADPKSRAYLDQVVRYRNAVNPDEKIDFNNYVTELAKTYTNYAYTNKLIDIQYREDPSYRISMMKKIAQELNTRNILMDEQLDYTTAIGNPYRHISALDLIRVTSNKLNQQVNSPDIAGYMTFNRALRNIVNPSSVRGEDFVKTLLMDKEEFAKNNISLPIVQEAERRLGPGYTLRDFVKTYNKLVDEIGGKSVRVIRRFDEDTSNELTNMYLTKNYISNATIYEVTKDGRLNPVEGKNNIRKVIDKFYKKSDTESNVTGGIIGITTPASGLPPSLVASTREGETYFIEAPAGVVNIYNPITKLVEGALSNSGESSPQILPLNINGVRASVPVKAKGRVSTGPSGIPEMVIDLYRIDPETGQEEIMVQDAQDLLEQMSKEVEAVTLPRYIGTSNKSGTKLLNQFYPSVFPYLNMGLFE